MNSRQRVFSILQGKPVDRRPFGGLMSLYGAKLTGCPLFKYYNDAAEYARGQDAIRQTICPDFLIGPFMLAGYGEAFGSTLRYFDNYVPNLLKPVISCPEDLSRLIVPDIDSHPRLLYFRDALRRIKASHGTEAQLVSIVLNPLDLPLVIMGLDAWLRTVLTDEDSTRKMLDIVIPFFVRYCNALFEDGADALAIPMAFLTRDITTRSLAANFAVPILREALAELKGPVIAHHTGSSFFDTLDLLCDLPNLIGLAMDADDDIVAARSLVNSETVLFAGPDGPSLHTVSADWVKATCLERLSTLRNDPRYVPFATGTDVSMDTPVANLIAIRTAVEEFGNGQP